MSTSSSSSSIFIEHPPPRPYFDSTQDLLSRFQLLSAFDKYVKPYSLPVGAPGSTQTPQLPASVDKGKGKEKERDMRVPKRAVLPFHPTNSILLLGEGNFSFTLALVNLDTKRYTSLPTHIPAYNITATAYDTEEECYEKYPEASKIVDEIKARGVRVLFGVDAGNLEGCKALKGKKWDRVVVMIHNS